MAGILVGMVHGENKVGNGSCAWIHKAKVVIVDDDLTDALGVGWEVIFKEEGLIEVSDGMVDTAFYGVVPFFPVLWGESTGIV